MAFTPPDFNVLANLWFGTNTPNTGLFDFENQACQLYVTSRGPFDVDGLLPNNFSPPIYFRMPWASDSNWRETQIVECPAGSLRYYRVRWKEYMHVGFPNQYLVIILNQCDGDGNPILRDVDAPPGPIGHTGTGGGPMLIFPVGVGVADNLGHVRTGSGVVAMVITEVGIGSATH